MINLVNNGIKRCNLPDDKGFFGNYGGSFIPQQLQEVIDEVTREYERISKLSYYLVG